MIIPLVHIVNTFYEWVLLFFFHWLCFVDFCELEMFGFSLFSANPRIPISLYESFANIFGKLDSTQFQTNWLAYVCKKEKQGCSQIDIFIFIIVKTSSDFQRIIALTEANLPFEPRCPSVGWLVIMSKRAGQLHFHSFHTPINIFIFFINIVYIIIIIIAFYSSVTAAPWWEANTIWYS